MNSTTRNLRPRRKVNLSAPVKNVPKETFVSKMIFTITYNGKTEKHCTEFDENELSLKEMYKIGFLGDIEFRHGGGLVEKADLEAGPIGAFKGDEVGRFVFRITRVSDGKPINAHVVKFNFVKFL
ncbi:MAG: hypothetical protein IJ161_08375 [Bacteroidales bacterium]|nr:hypothetical protein [Bacteroidales bacterium]